METLEIHSLRDLATNTLVRQSPGEYRYEIDRHQFIAAYSARQHDESLARAPLGLTTAAAERIWMNDRESAEVATAIRTSRSTVTLT